MPLYEYQCETCEHRFEKIQKYTDPAPDGCPKCGSAVRKLASSPAIQFKGTGWYITDYAKKSGSDSGKSGKSESSDTSGGGDKSDSKSDTSSTSQAGTQTDSSGKSSSSDTSGSAGKSPADTSSAKRDTPAASKDT